MRLESVTVRRFRSITDAHKLSLADRTVLIGPNNEGKSNILRALVLALNLLTTRSYMPESDSGLTRIRRNEYDWERDFPKHLQDKKGSKSSVVQIVFALNEREIEMFREYVGNKVNGTLPIEITIGKGNKFDVKVRKQGRGAKSLSGKSSKIANFVSALFGLEYIPAIRTADSAIKVVEDMLQRELEVVEDNPEYKKAMRKIAEIQEPILQNLSESIKKTLVQFLPDINTVSVKIPPGRRSRALRRSAEVLVDDGSSTGLDLKGEGVQSLAALGIMRYASESESANRSLLIAIEEPESHLHPGAIRKLKEVLDDLSGKHQVIITTHCPLLVDRTSVRANVLVHGNRAVAAKSVSEIRQVLGVRPSDNLRNAELVVLVEGDNDRIALQSILNTYSATMSKRLKSGAISIDSLHSASNLSDRLRYLRDSLCPAICFLDADDAGRSAAEQAQDEGLLAVPDTFFATSEGRRQSEFEGIIAVSIYKTELEKQLGITLDSPRFKTNKKWTHRLSATMTSQGKQLNDRIESLAKQTVRDQILIAPRKALRGRPNDPVTQLARAINASLSRE